MLSVKKFKRILKKHNIKLSTDEILKLRDELYALGNLALDSYLKKI